MTSASWVELCVSDLEQSIRWFEHVLGFRVIALETNEFVELSSGETSILLASDDSPYWASERPRLLPSGQRGSGVEIILLVENVYAVYRQAQQARADILCEPADFPWHLRQFWVRHPDGYLIRPAQKILSVNPATYHHQIATVFQRNVPHIAEELAKVKQEADRLLQQQDYLGAATIYEMLVTEIFEKSHLYAEEEEAYDDYYEEEAYYPEEEGLEEFIGVCIEALGHCLADERTDRVAREKCIEVLFDIYRQDVYESHGFMTSAANQLVRYTTSLERDRLAEQIRTLMTKAGGSVRQSYGKFLLDLQKEILGDEAYLHICREAGLTSYLIDRLLALGHSDEAARETQSIENDDQFLGLANLFIHHQQDAMAERLVKARCNEKPTVRVLEWLQTYYQARENYTATLEVTETLFRTQPLLKHYQRLRELARQLDYWQTLRPALLAFLVASKTTRLLIEIALDEGEIDKALQQLKELAKKDRYGTTYEGDYGYGIDLKVAQAAEETDPHEAITLYQQRAERLIAQRDRKQYHEACTFLAKMRSVYEKIDERGAWASYMATLRQQNRNLPALKDELAKAKL
ncbi:MAG: VOC family protein [Ktedonobacteraceae bacterium]|nr:VOC family protein [Ktedonobacteraceae bacterium]